MRRALLTAVACAVAAATAAAQSGSLASRIEAVREGTVRMAFPARPGVCGDGNGSVWIADQGRYGGWNDRRLCIGGPVVVRIGRSGGQTVSVRKWVGVARSAGSDEVDLGVVSAPDAAKYLMALAHSIAGGSADDAITAAVFADGVDLSPELKALVRDDSAPLEPRRQALFWFGQSSAPTSDLTGLYDTLGPSTLREHFTFVLSQRRDDDQALDKLMAIARGDRDFEIRKRAMFWLGQSKDPRAAKFLRDLILR